MTVSIWKAWALGLASLALGASALPEGIHGRLLRAQSRQGQVRILHFGDSHLAATPAQMAYGQVFRGTPGDASTGLGLPWIQPRPGVKSARSKGWSTVTRARGDESLGLAGGFLETLQGGQWARLEGRFSRMRLHFLRTADGGSAEIRVDGNTLGHVGLCGKGLQVFDREIPAAWHQVEIHTRGGRVRLLGAALEEGPGVVHSPLAFNGAEASWLSRIPEPLFQAQIRAEAPDLVILAFGTNEAAAPAFRGEAYRSALEAVLDRFRRAAPQAGLVLVGPPDGRFQRGTPGALDAVVDLQRRVAASRGAVFVDQRQAMGGSGAIAEWLRSGLASQDLVHLSAPGYLRLAASVTRELMPGLHPVLPALPTRARKGSLPAGPAPTPAAPQIALAKPNRVYTLWFEDGTCLITDNARAGEQGSKKVVRVESTE